MKAARFLFVLAFLFPPLTHAGDVALTVYGGYNTGGNIDVREDMVRKLSTAGSVATGLSLTWQRSPTYAFELFWGWRPTSVESEVPAGEEKRTASLDEHDFHGNFLFMPAYSRGKATPFLLLGLGATYLNPGDVGELSPDGAARFSWALGGGVKGYMNERLGLRAQVRYHSTYVADEAGGTWCDYYYGCYQTVDTNWLDEWDFTGGIMIRLGGI